MVREFSEEKRQEIFRMLDEIDNREWKSFMEWCGSSAEEFGDWPDKLSVSAYTRYVDEYHQKVLELNEMTRQRVNTVFENVAEIDARYAARMRECQEKIKEQIAIVRTMTEFMQSMTDGNPNMALITKGSANENCVSTEIKDKKKEKLPTQSREEMMEDDSGSPCAGGAPILDDNGYLYAGAATVLERIETEEGTENLPEEDSTYENNEEDIVVLERYINEEFLSGALDWDLEQTKINLGENYIEDMRALMLEYGLTDERSILLFLITVTYESDHGRGMTEYGNEEYINEQSYSEDEKGAGLIQLTFKENQTAFLKYITGITSDGAMEDLLDGMSSAEYIAKNYPIESALWFWCVYDDKVTFDGRNSSINYAIEQYGNNTNLYAMFIATQCIVNQTGYNPRGCGRMFLPENEVYYENGRIHLNYFENSNKICIDDGKVPVGMENRIDLYNSCIYYITNVLENCANN